MNFVQTNLGSRDARRVLLLLQRNELHRYLEGLPLNMRQPLYLGLKMTGFASHSVLSPFEACSYVSSLTPSRTDELCNAVPSTSCYTRHPRPFAQWSRLGCHVQDVLRMSFHSGNTRLLGVCHGPSLPSDMPPQHDQFNRALYEVRPKNAHDSREARGYGTFKRDRPQ